MTADQMREALYWIDLAQHALLQLRHDKYGVLTQPFAKVWWLRKELGGVWREVNLELLATDEVRADYKRAGLTLVTPKELDALRERALRFMTPMEERE
jgi:hypothetical protein